MEYLEELIAKKTKQIKNKDVPVSIEYESKYLEKGFIGLNIYFISDDISMGFLKDCIIAFFEEVFINNDTSGVTSGNKVKLSLKNRIMGKVIQFFVYKNK